MGVSGVLLILGVVFAFFLRFRVLVAMLLTIGTGCLWSFGVARFTVGYLNSASGFLVSIIAGNGINFGILLMARYLEARRTEGRDAAESVRVAMRGTAAGTLTVAVTSSVAYGSLALTDFRGFRHFGIIGGVGMLLCWVASYTLLPALLVVIERVAPLRTESGTWRSRVRGLFGRPFAFLAARYSGAVLAVAGVSLALSLVLTVRYFARDPLEYDMKKVRNDASSQTSAQKLTERVAPIVGRLTREGRAILVDRVDQVAPLEATLERRRDEAPADKKPFDRVVSAFDLLPKDQPEKLPLLATIEDRARRAHGMGAISDDDWRQIERELPAEPRALGIADLPEDIAWPFEESDGTRGRVVYLVPTKGASLDDVHYLMRWADSFRKVKLPNGDVIRGTGDPVIFSDMLKSVGKDGPKAMLEAVLGTIAVVLFAFRGRRSGLLALASIGLGLTWLIGFLSLSGTHINFLNFVALPITVGVGADYAVNILKRFELEGSGALRRVLTETGGAVVLCSMTTLLGYAALTLSINGAVRSFGMAGAVGEITTLTAAVLVLPAWLFATKGRARPKPREAPTEEGWLDAVRHRGAYRRSTLP